MTSPDSTWLKFTLNILYRTKIVRLHAICEDRWKQIIVKLAIQLSRLICRSLTLNEQGSKSCLGRGHMFITLTAALFVKFRLKLRILNTATYYCSSGCDPQNIRLSICHHAIEKFPWRSDKVETRDLKWSGFLCRGILTSNLPNTKIELQSQDVWKRILGSTSVSNLKSQAKPLLEIKCLQEAAKRTVTFAAERIAALTTKLQDMRS